MATMCKVTITCEECGYRHSLERNTFTDGELIEMTCHGCEIRLQTVFRKPVGIPRAPEYSFGERGSVWF